VDTLFARALAATIGIALIAGPLGAVPAVAAGAPATVADAALSASDAADSFNDVPPNHWAYQAVQELAADGYVKGYPDGTFRGNRPLTRYELVALIDRALSSVIAAQINGDAVNARDLALLKKLMTQYAGDLKDLQSQVATIKSRLVVDESQRVTDESRQSADEAAIASVKQDVATIAAAIAKNRGGMQFSYQPATSYLDLEATNGPYARAVGAAGTLSPAVAANAPFPANYGAYPGITRGTNFSWGPGTTNSTYTGPAAQGTTDFGIRAYFQGQLDSHFSYQIRLSFIDQVAQPTGLSSDNKAFCTSSVANAGAPPGSTLGAYPCTYQDNSGGNQAIAFNINRYYVQWASMQGGAGVGGQLGKISPTNNTGSRNINPILGYNQKLGGELYYLDPSPRQWLEVVTSFGQNPTGVSSEQLAQVNAISPVCTVVQGLNSGTLAANAGTFGVNPNCNGSSQEMYSFIQLYNQKTATAVGFNQDHLNDYPFAYWNPGAGLCATSAANALAGTASAVALTPAACQGATPFALTRATGAYMTEQGPINLESIWFSQVIGSKNAHRMIFQGDYGFRTGNDPFTGNPWTGNSTKQLTFIYASKGNIGWGRGAPTYATVGGTGTKDSNVIFATALFTGLNSISPYQGPNGSWQGVGYNTGISNFSGTQFEALQYAHWFSNNVNLSLALVHQGTLPGVNIPAGSTGCPGCYIDHVNSNIINLNYWMSY